MPGAEPGHTYFTRRGGWIVSYDRDGWGLLLDRETGRAWRWPRVVDGLRLVATSGDHVIFEELGDGPAFIRRFTIASGEMEEVARFSIDSEGHWLDMLFSPDGRVIALSAADTVYLVATESARFSVLFRALPEDSRPGETRVSARVGNGVYDPSQIRVVVSYDGPAVQSREERHYFTWDGDRVRGPACPGPHSPDGRYVAQPTGGAFHYARLLVRDDGSVYREDRGYLAGGESAWGLVVIAAADTAPRCSARNRRIGSRQADGLTTGCRRVTGSSWAYMTGTPFCASTRRRASFLGHLQDRMAPRAGNPKLLRRAAAAT